jgi:hypothetical protein
MSSYKTLTNYLDYRVGDIVFDTKEPYSGWALCNGAIQLQSTNTELYSKVGLIRDIPTPSFSLINSGTTSYIRSMAYGTSKYVYGSTIIAYSTDRRSWTTATTFTVNYFINKIKFLNNSLFIAGGGRISTAASLLLTSVNGSTWTTRTAGVTTLIRGLAYGASKYVFTTSGNEVRTSTNGTTWASSATLGFSGTRDLIYENSKFTVVGDGGNMATSTDAVTWSTVTSGTSSTIFSIAFGNSKYVYGGANGAMATSTDSVTWSTVTSGTASNINEVFYNTEVEKFYYCGDGGIIGVSYDGLTWSTITTGTVSNIYSIHDYMAGISTGNLIVSNTHTYNVQSEFALPNISIILTNSRANAYIKIE